MDPLGLFALEVKAARGNAGLTDIALDADPGTADTACNDSHSAAAEKWIENRSSRRQTKKLPYDRKRRAIPEAPLRQPGQR
jgi:hypothetical protein